MGFQWFFTSCSTTNNLKTPSTTLAALVYGMLIYTKYDIEKAMKELEVLNDTFEYPQMGKEGDEIFSCLLELWLAFSTSAWCT